MSEQNIRPRAVAVDGPTGSGKSALAMRLARRLNAEIICMDSMQIYRRMDIGTAKPTLEEQRRVPHHMLDVVEPTQPYAVADYAVAAEKVILDVARRGRVPLLVGGTGLYLKALTHGLSLGGVHGDEALRERLKAEAAAPDGKRRLHARLAEVDAESAARLDPNDVRRVVRALEVYTLTGKPISAQEAPREPRPFRILPLALDMPRNMLFERIERRVRQMMAQGLPGEVAALLSSGVPPAAQAMQGIGYKELVPVARGEMPLADAEWRIVVNTRHYAKRQGTWLRAQPETVWLCATDGALEQQAMALIEAYLNGGEA